MLCIFCILENFCRDNKMIAHFFRLQNNLIFLDLAICKNARQSFYNSFFSLFQLRYGSYSSSDNSVSNARSAFYEFIHFRMSTKFCPEVLQYVQPKKGCSVSKLFISAEFQTIPLTVRLSCNDKRLV